MSDLLVTDIGQLVTNDPVRGGLLGILDNAAVAIVGGVIAWVGGEADVPPDYLDLFPP